MKAYLEEGVEHPGVIIKSETLAEMQRLRDIWDGHGRFVEFGKLDSGMVELTIAPSSDDEVASP